MDFVISIPQSHQSQEIDLKNGALGVVLAGLLSACSLPSQEGRSVTHALLSEDSTDTPLGQGVASVTPEDSTLSGVLPLYDPLDAFAARMLLIAAAQRTLDIQYYIWRDDITGNLLLHALHQAAQRQVRVRLLLDDNGISGLDAKLALLNAEPNVEVRLFNPFPFRVFKPLGFLTDFRRVNRRMHNKSFTVDGQLTIVGGRNIGDEYFGATQGMEFADLDVLVAGNVVDDMSRDFDRYWNSQSAYPIEHLVRLPNEQKAHAILHSEAQTAMLPKAQAYVEAVRKSSFISRLTEGKLPFQWSQVRMVSDDPDKVLDKVPPRAMLLSRLMEVLDKPTESVDLVSPYFVPTRQGTLAFGQLAKRGVKVRILTNALEATDVAAVHAGYAKYRAPLLKHGIELFELRRQSHRRHAKEKAGPFGSSGSSLHAKTFAVDGKRVFVGSFNFDPRSASLNTELGFLIESPELAKAVGKTFDDDVPDYAYQLGLDENERLYWIRTDADGHREILYDEPGVPLTKRLFVRFLSVMPIESLL